MKYLFGFLLLLTTKALAVPVHRSQCVKADDQRQVELSIEKSAGLFKVRASAGMEFLFERGDLRPSLNVRVNDEANDIFKEFIDFNDKGLEIIPVGGVNKLEIDLKSDSAVVHYTDGNKSIQLECVTETKDLITFLRLTPRERVNYKNVKAVAFDIDDTLAFTSPAFARGFATGGTPKPDDVLFWTHTNACDAGCTETIITLDDGSLKVLPANAQSGPKTKAIALIQHHKSLGHKVYAITARPDINGAPLRAYLQSEFGINSEDVFFEPDIDQPGNPAGKTDRIESLNLDVFYGDSDSDITDTLKAFVDESGVRTKRVHAVRFLRSPKSSNRKAGELNKYHPGYFGEPILAESY